MARFVMVAGGWHGGWALAPVARKLRVHGHDVFTPSLTGLGERAHLAAARPNLDTHIEDVANVLLFEEIEDVVLCGHSYAGMVITGVADRLAERIAALVYIDAFVPADGQSWWDLAGDRYRQLAIENSAADGFGVAPPPHLDRRCVAHPLASFRQAIRLTGRWQAVREKVFIYASGWPATPFTATYEALSRDPGWSVHSIPTGHNVPLDAQDELLSIALALRAVA
jgi:pimeloyl-ACP methyl ester carboxylesterase